MVYVCRVATRNRGGDHVIVSGKSCKKSPNSTQCMAPFQQEYHDDFIFLEYFRRLLFNSDTYFSFK